MPPVKEAPRTAVHVVTEGWASAAELGLASSCGEIDSVEGCVVTRRSAENGTGITKYRKSRSTHQRPAKGGTETDGRKKRRKNMETMGKNQKKENIFGEKMEKKGEEKGKTKERNNWRKNGETNEEKNEEKK